jgi:Na+-driven multidrug efflux pump
MLGFFLKKTFKSEESCVAAKAMALRLIGAACGFISVRMAFSAIGVDGVAGIFMIQAVAGWFFWVDAGTGIAAQNFVAKSIAEGRDYRSGLVRILRIPFYLALSGVPIIILTGNYWFPFFASGKAAESLINYKWYVVGLVALQLLVSSSGSIWRIYYAERKGELGNWIQSGGSLITFLGILVLKITHWGGFIAYSLAVLAPSAILPYVFFLNRLRIGKKTEFTETCERPSLHDIGSVFLFNLSAALVLKVDVLVLGRVAAASAVGAYVCLQRIMSLIQVWSMSLQAANQSAITRAWAKQDPAAIRTILWKLILHPLPAVILPGLLLICFDSRIAGIMTSGKIQSFGWPMIFFATLYYLVRLWTDAWSVAILALGNAVRLVIPTLIQGCLLIPLIYFLGRSYGGAGVYAAMAVSMFVCNSWYAYYFIKKRYLSA